MADENKPTEPESTLKPFIANSLSVRVAAHNGVYMSFDPTTPEGGTKLVMGTLSALPPIKSMIGKEIKITDVYIHPVSSIDDETGELQNFARTVIYTSDGRAYDCGSMGILKSLDVLSMVRGAPPWVPGIAVVVDLRDVGGRKQWLSLQPVMDQLFKPTRTPNR